MKCFECEVSGLGEGCRERQAEGERKALTRSRLQSWRPISCSASPTPVGSPTCNPPRQLPALRRTARWRSSEMANGQQG
eukprot:1576047-Rhodomonas_salina.1